MYSNPLIRRLFSSPSRAAPVLWACLQPIAHELHTIRLDRNHARLASTYSVHVPVRAQLVHYRYIVLARVRSISTRKRTALGSPSALSAPSSRASSSAASSANLILRRPALRSGVVCAYGLFPYT
eukprot:COSAG05_NODE_1308_length_5225_cov_3.554233_4_plen_125_part_00